MSISTVNYSNTFAHWLIATNQLIDQNNTLSANNYYKTQGTLFLNSSGVALSVSNNALFSGNITFNGTSSKLVEFYTPVKFYSSIVANNVTVTGTLTSNSTAFSGIISPSNLGTGYAGSNTYLRGDNTWQEIVGGGGGSSVSITNETVKNSTYYPLLVTTTSGTLTTSNVSSSKLSFNPSTGTLTATKFVGDGSGLTGISGGGGSIGVSNNTISSVTHYPLFTTTTSGTLSAANVASSKLSFTPDTGTLSATIFNSLSDQKVKTNVKTISDGLSIISQLRGVEFDWLESGKHSSGVIAQEIEEILPFLVDGNEEKSVNYSGLIGYLISAIIELNEKIDKLKSQ